MERGDLNSTAQDKELLRSMVLHSEGDPFELVLSDVLNLQFAQPQSVVDYSRELELSHPLEAQGQLIQPASIRGCALTGKPRDQLSAFALGFLPFGGDLEYPAERIEVKIRNLGQHKLLPGYGEILKSMSAVHLIPRSPGGPRDAGRFLDL